MYTLSGERTTQILRILTRHPAIKTSLTMGGCRVEISRTINFSHAMFFCGTEYSSTAVVQDTTQLMCINLS